MPAPLANDLKGLVPPPGRRDSGRRLMPSPAVEAMLARSATPTSRVQNRSETVSLALLRSRESRGALEPSEAGDGGGEERAAGRLAAPAARLGANATARARREVKQAWRHQRRRASDCVVGGDEPTAGRSESCSTCPFISPLCADSHRHVYVFICVRACVYVCACHCNVTCRVECRRIAGLPIGLAVPCLVPPPSQCSNVALSPSALVVGV